MGGGGAGGSVEGGGGIIILLPLRYASLITRDYASSRFTVYSIIDNRYGVRMLKMENTIEVIIYL